MKVKFYGQIPRSSMLNKKKQSIVSNMCKLREPPPPPPPPPNYTSLWIKKLIIQTGSYLWWFWFCCLHWPLPHGLMACPLMVLHFRPFASCRQNQNHHKMFLPTITRMSEFVMLYPSQFGCAKSSILTRLNPMYIDSSCPNLDIGIKIPSMCINSTVIDPKEWCCVARCTFLLRHIIPSPGDKLTKSTKKSFHVFSFDDTEEKVAVRFEGERSQGGEGSQG